MMQITVNGQPHELETSLSVLELTQRLQLDPRQLAIERNRAIVPRSLYCEVRLEAGDAIEIVHFIGGG